MDDFNVHKWFRDSYLYESQEGEGYVTTLDGLKFMPSDVKDEKGYALHFIPHLNSSDEPLEVQINSILETLRQKTPYLVEFLDVDTSNPNLVGVVLRINGYSLINLIQEKFK